MDSQTISQKLKDINLNFDIQTIHSVQNFLLKDIGFISQIDPQYQIFGGAAIISQIQTLPNVGRVGQSKNGIKIENVMSHLENLSKQTFLETLNRQLQKYKNPPQTLKKKIQDIKYSYRFYKKYQATFQALYDKFIVSKICKQQFSALFWIVYLYVKNLHIQTQNIGQAKTLLILLFRQVFEKFISNHSFDDIYELMVLNIGTITQISQEKQNFYFTEIQKVMNKFYCQRHSQNQVNFNKLLNNSILVQRIVDDMSNDYVKKQRDNELDELSFLQLKKNLTPQVFRKMQTVEQIQPIGDLLKFQSDHQQENDNEVDGNSQTPVKKPIMESPFDKVPTPQSHNSSISPDSTPKWKQPSPKIIPMSNFSIHYEETPITIKVQNQIWLKGKINSIKEINVLEFKQSFQSLFNQSYSELQMDIKQKNMCLIKNFTPKCPDVQGRHKQMFNFFIKCYLQIQKSQIKLFNPNQNQKSTQILKGIACLASQLYNYVNNSISYEYKYHCQTFSLEITKSSYLIQLFTQIILSTNSTPDLEDYLKKVSKRLMVSQIWQNQQGYKILCQAQNIKHPQFLQIHSVYQKIVDQSQKRVDQICRQVRIQRKITTKTINMINHIFEKKPYLLRYNNIDQIIICCLMSCLSINQKEKKQTLEKLFYQYNSNIQFSYNCNQHNLKSNEGKQMGIIDYYNDVFLQEIQDLINSQVDQLDDFLVTPVRIDIMKNSLDRSFKNKFSNFSNLRQKAGTLGFNPQKSIKQRKASLMQNMIKQNSQMQQEKQEDEDYQSPNFGRVPLIRNFSFGPSTSQK